MENMSWADKWRHDSEEWVDADNAASLLEGLHGVVFAQKVKGLLASDPKMPVNRAENEIKCSSDWEQYIRNEVQARTTANLKKIKAEHTKMKYYEWQSSEANNRAEMRL